MSIWIYAYSKGTGSAREISRLCEYDPAYQWLTGMEPINYHTLADFRSSHKDSLDRLFVEVLGIMSAEGLITLERVMHDGTKIKALAGNNSFRREERIREHFKAAEEQVRQSSRRGGEPAGPKSTRRGPCKKRRNVWSMPFWNWRRSESKIAGGKEGSQGEHDRSGCPHHETVGRGYAPSYNVQLSTDATAGVIIGVGVSQRPGRLHELMTAIERIEKNFGKIPRQVVADGGYTHWENIVAMDAAGVDFIGSLMDRNPGCRPVCATGRG